MDIRKANNSDLKDVLSVETQAFGDEHGPEIAKLVSELLNDPTAKPILSLLAVDNNQAIGHILFTNASITDSEKPISASILAPLAILPDAQNQGIGGKLIKEGIKLLSKSGTDLVFVLGHPDYYPRYGFKPAGALGFEAPYPIPEKNAGAWMVQELHPAVIGKVAGRVICADVMNKPEYWRE